MSDSGDPHPGNRHSVGDPGRLEHGRSESEDVALAFLHAYWRADLEDALAHCTEGALMELPASVPMRTPAKVADLLPAIFHEIYPRFRGGRFDVRIDNVVSAQSSVVVEYLATGSLVNGREFRCRYVMVLTVRNRKIEFARSYTDTRYVTAELLAEPELAIAADSPSKL